jgi:uncharacterized GH25 family protein
MRTLLLLVASALLTCNIFAHALWIETRNTGSIGKTQDIRLYFGEYAQNERDELSKWRSDLKDLTLWLVKPDGAREKLTVRQDSNAVISTFTPTGKGVYMLIVSHPLKDLSGTAQLEFLASTHVLVGSSAGMIDQTLNNNDLKVFPLTDAGWKVNRAIKIKVLAKGVAKAGNTVLVFSPSGWSRELTTDADGTVSFTPLWPGKYVIEAQEFSRTPGELNGNKYATLWQGATYSFDISR